MGEKGMKKTAAQKSTEQIVNDIWNLDLEPIKFKLMDSREGQGWSAEIANQYETEYKRFLTLLVKHPDKTIAPTKMVDAFWHAHILDTMKYADDCEKVFGYFLHHYPYFGMRGDEDAARLAEAFDTMQTLHKDEFGSDQSAYCGVAAVKDGHKASYCGASAAGEGQEAAYCGAAEPQHEKAAYCGIASVREMPAYCGIASPGMKAAAYCGAAISGLKAEVSYCGAAFEKGSGDVAYCGVASVRRPERPVGSGKEAGLA